MLFTLRVEGVDRWIKGAIERGTLIAATDESYMWELTPNVCSAAFILECSKEDGGITGVFAEASRDINAYRGELLGLMVIYLNLLVVNKM